MNTNRLKSAYEATYQHAATAIYFVPGRVNLIGDGAHQVE